MKIGVLSLQGGVIEHINHIRALGAEALEVRSALELDDLDGIILPGGESTTMGKLLRERDMLEALRNKIINGLPVWGTCAGMILLAKEIDNDTRRHLEVMDIKVRRNAYGSQLDSFKKMDCIKEVSDKSIPLVFIRAPYIVETGDNVDILHRIGGKVVAAKQGNILATSFHPELAEDLTFHNYFLEICRGQQ